MTNGFGFRGFASGLQTGLGLGLERQRIKSLADERKALEKAKEEEKLAMNTWLMDNRESIENYSNLPQEERNWLIASSFQYSDKMATFFNDWDKAIKTNDSEEIKNKQKQWEDILATKKDLALAGINLTDGFFIDGTQFDPNKPLVPQKDINYLRQIEIGKMAGGKTGEVMGRQMWEKEGFGELPKAPSEAPKLSEEKSAVDRLISIADLPPETYNAQLQSFLNRGLDVGMYTQDMAKKLKTATKKYYSSAGEAMANSPNFKDLDKQPVMVELGKFKIDYTKKTVPTPTPEGEVTAGQKRVTDMAQSTLFGGKDSMGMPTSVGIIPMDIQISIGAGRDLTDEEKSIISNNYNLRKDTLKEPIRKYIESILKQLEIDLEAKPAPEPTPKPEIKKTGFLEGVGKAISDWWKGTPQEIAPTKVKGDYWTEKYGF